jgi:hypothetical protein
MKMKNKDVLRKVSYIIIAIGLLGIIAMLVLSYIIPAIKVIPDSIGPPVPSISSETEQDNSENMTQYYTTRIVRGDWGAFLETFRLNALFAACCVLTVLGVAMLISTFFLLGKKNQGG